LDDVNFRSVELTLFAVGPAAHLLCDFGGF